jgi:ribonuclease P protein component
VAKQFTIGREERLKSLKAIERLFKQGQRFTAGFFKVHYVMEKQTAKQPVQFGVGVSTKNFKRAVDRNRIKRLTREAYRLQKNMLQDTLKENQIRLDLFLVYTAKELPLYNDVYEKVGIALKKMLKQVNENVVTNS